MQNMINYVYDGRSEWPEIEWIIIHVLRIIEYSEEYTLS